MEEEMRQSARGLLAGGGALLLLSGTVLGVLFFALMGVAGYASGRYEFSLIGVAGVGGLVYGCSSFLRPSAREGLAIPHVPWSPLDVVSREARGGSHSPCGWCARCASSGTMQTPEASGMVSPGDREGARQEPAPQAPRRCGVTRHHAEGAMPTSLGMLCPVPRLPEARGGGTSASGRPPTSPGWQLPPHALCSWPCTPPDTRRPSAAPA